jgi:hypothetical protein
VHVAEQVSIERPTASVLEILRPTVLVPFLQIAWSEGELALRHRGVSWATTPSEPRHSLRLTPRSTAADATVLAVAWSVQGAVVLFRTLRGQLIVRSFDDGSTLEMVATYSPIGDPSSSGTARRPVEIVVRSFLGHVRNAVES